MVPPHTIIRQRRLGYNSIVALILFHSEEHLDPDLDCRMHGVAPYLTLREFSLPNMRSQKDT